MRVTFFLGLSGLVQMGACEHLQLVGYFQVTPDFSLERHKDADRVNEGDGVITVEVLERSHRCRGMPYSEYSCFYDMSCKST